MGEEDRRIEELEMKLTYQEAAVEDLGALVLDQGRRLERLEEQMRRVTGKLKELEEGAQQPLPKGERPPHY
ncbi:MAG: SlyX family protein [Treponema sp.]|nr:SlyX family protein [Treponema sp.]